MDTKDHVLVQKIISNIHALEYMVKVFERVLEERNLWDAAAARSKSLRESGDAGRWEEYYRALLFSEFFRNTNFEDASEYIDLAQKDMLARQMLQYLNVTRGDPEKIRELLHRFCEIPVGRFHVSPSVTLGIRVDLISQFINDHSAYISVAKNHITMRDVERVLSRSIGSVSQPGLVGGKAAGMILANRILRPTLKPVDPELAGAIEETDSYFVKSCIAAEYVNRNGLQECHSMKYLNEKEMDSLRDTLYDRFIGGAFSDHVNERFMNILADTEGTPLILRSSSYLEDSAGHSFSGKYESVFISNEGTIDERFEELTRGIKLVYLSLYSAPAIEYRRDRNLLDHNERMAVLIQKVVGSRCGKYFFPSVSMVGFSKNAHCWSSRIKKEDGMLRIVMGLGTRAVERVGDDYPRMVSLSDPTLRPEVTIAEQIKYSQRDVDVINLETRQLETHNFVDLLNEIAAEGGLADLKDIVSVAEDGMLKTPLFVPGKLEHGKCAITFDGLLNNKKFSQLMRMVLEKVESAYGSPVDMEFAFHGNKLHVLQCRHLSERAVFEGKISIPEVSEEDILFTARRGFASAVVKDIDTIVYVDDDEYASLPSSEKRTEVARAVGRVNRALAQKRFVLMGPGRWGTSNMNLGVPVKYNDINNARILIEVARERNGVTPEVSHGTHFFQDLVEADIIPLPLYPDSEDAVFKSSFFMNARNMLAALDPEAREYEKVLKVIDVPKQSGGRRLHVYLDGTASYGVGLLA